MDQLATLLAKQGPRRSSDLAGLMQKRYGVSAEAARKRLSRARDPILSFPFSLLPKREAFLYLESDRNTERFWTNFHAALRETDTVYAAAIDGLLARGGVTTVDEFDVISGAPLRQKNHVPAALVRERMVRAGFMREVSYADIGEIIMIHPNALGDIDLSGHMRRRAVEGVLLDGLREWARKLGLASYNAIAIRGDAHPRAIGPYRWDLTGPSYLLPLRTSGARNGFLAADVFAEGILTPDQLRYAAKKAEGLRATPNVGRLLPIVLAQGFTGPALTFGRRAGLLLATPDSLFGAHVGRAIRDLLTTLSKKAEMVSGNPDKIAGLIEDLSEIEGAAGNLRGILFELMVAFLVRQEGSIDMGRKAFDPGAGRYADLDILLVKGRSKCVAIECKGKGPGNNVTLDEVDDWLRRIPAFKAHVRDQSNLREAEMSFELWASGGFEPDALARLKREQSLRTRTPIAWKDGAEIRRLSQKLKETRLTKAFDEHFFRHPLAQS